MRQLAPEITLEDGIAVYRKNLENALGQLHQKGFTEPAPPQFTSQQGITQVYRGELPADLTALTDDNLGWYMGALAEWNNYVEYQLAVADANLTAAKAEKELVSAKLSITYKKGDDEKKRSNPERENHVKVDHRYIEADSKVVYWDTLYRITRAIANGAEQNFNAVSRRITQRGQELERSRRDQGTNHNVNMPHGGVVFGAGRRT